MNKWWLVAGAGALLGLLWKFGRRRASMQHGLDVSDWQHDIDWSSVKQSGFTVAIIKCSEGQTFQANLLEQNGYGASTQNMLVNYYHFARLDNLGGMSAVVDARMEAENCLDAVSKVPAPHRLTFASGRTAAIWLDCEKKPELESWDKEDGLAWMLEFFRVVEQFYPVGIYSKKSWLDQVVNAGPTAMERILNRPNGSQRAFWVARYGQNIGVPQPEYSPNEKIPDIWGSWDIWQYTSKGIVAGIEGNVDLNLVMLAA